MTAPRPAVLEFPLYHTSAVPGAAVAALRSRARLLGILSVNGLGVMTS